MTKLQLKKLIKETISEIDIDNMSDFDSFNSSKAEYQEKIAKDLDDEKWLTIANPPGRCKACGRDAAHLFHSEISGNLKICGKCSTKEAETGISALD